LKVFLRRKYLKLDWMLRTKNYQGRNFNKKRVADKMSKKQRSNLMSKIRSKNTNLESNFFKFLKKTTRLKFITNVTTITGKPDVIFLKDKVCIFIDSDFWHGWQYPRWKHLLKDDFWRKKIENNRKRDKKVTKYLRDNGWKVLRFWEHHLRNEEETVVKKILKSLSR